MQKKKNAIPRRINIKRRIQLGDESLSILDYLKSDNELYDPELISVMADECCDAIDAVRILQERRQSELLV